MKKIKQIETKEEWLKLMIDEAMDKAIKEAEKYCNKFDVSPFGTFSDFRQNTTNKFFDKILNENLEGRTCENCKHHKDIEKSFKKCSELQINTSDDFGCNLFEAKDNK